MNFEKIVKADIRKNSLYNMFNESLINYRDGLWDYEITLSGIYGKYLDNKMTVHDHEYSEDEIRKEDEEILNLLQELEDDFSKKNLVEDVKEITEKEDKLIKYSELTGLWNGEIKLPSASAYARTEILMIKKLLKKLEDVSVEEIIELINEYQNTNYTADSIYCDRIKSIIDGTMYEGIDEKLQEEEDKLIEKLFNDRLNCGGYALKVDHCVFPSYKSNLDKDVAFILEDYPFTRLLGDTKLEDDEYLVIFRKTNNEYGHHFIRVEDDGTVMEKNAALPVQQFEKWDDELFCRTFDVCFAVKKEHDIDTACNKSYLGQNSKAKDFEETIKSSLEEKSNSFEYRGKKYLFKKSDNSSDEIYIISNNQLVAYMIDNGEEQLIEVVPEMEQYVINSGPNLTEKIKDGKLDLSLIRSNPKDVKSTDKQKDLETEDNSNDLDEEIK